MEAKLNIKFAHSDEEAKETWIYIVKKHIEESNEQVVHEMVKSKIGNEFSEEHDYLKQKTNIIIHGVGESQSTNAKDRQEFDLDYVLEMSNAALRVKLAGSEVNKIIRLGKPTNDGKSRPLLVSFANYDKKEEIFKKIAGWREIQENQYRAWHDKGWKLVEQAKKLGNLVVWVVELPWDRKLLKRSRKK